MSMRKTIIDKENLPIFLQSTFPRTNRMGFCPARTPPIISYGNLILMPPLSILTVMREFPDIFLKYQPSILPRLFRLLYIVLLIYSEMTPFTIIFLGRVTFPKTSPLETKGCPPFEKKRRSVEGNGWMCTKYQQKSRDRLGN